MIAPRALLASLVALAGTIFAVLAFSAAPKASAPGFIRVEKSGDRWSLVDPAGRSFFSRGLNHCSPEFFLRTYNRAATLERYGAGFAAPGATWPDVRSPAFAKWSDEQIERLRDWGFDAFGYHSPGPLLARLPDEIFYIASIRTTDSLTSHHRKGYPDPFTDAYARQIRQAVRPVVLAHRERKNLIGYAWTDGWGVDGLMRWWAQQLKRLDADAPGKRAWIGLLKQAHPTPEAAAAAHGVKGAATWEALAAAKNWRFDKSKPHPDDEAFTALIADRDYGLAAAACRELDPHHLVLGHKLRRPSEAVVRAAGKHVDAIFYETYLFGEEGSEYASRLARWSGRPVFMGDGGFGWLHEKRSHGKGPDLESPAGAGAFYAETLEAFARNPDLLGWHFCGFIEEWDEPKEAKGKNDDRVNDNGLIDPFGNEHREFVEAVRAANARASQPRLDSP